MPPTRARILLLTNDNFFSWCVLRDFLPARKEQIVGIVFSQALVGKKDMQSSLSWVLKNTGWRHFVFKSAVYGVFRVWNRLLALLGGRRWASSTLLWTRRNGVRHWLSSNINEPAFLDELRSLKPELIVSVSMNQVAKRELLKMPPLGCINVHCAPLPRYAGMSPYVWALANGEDYSAATIHYMEEGLDEGDILVQEKVPVRPGDSAFHLFWRCCARAGELLETTVSEIESSTQKSVPQDLSQRSYFSWPTPECVKSLRQRGYRLARTTDFLRAMFGGRA
ncbi:MAG: formyltransferase family protein [Phycisphaerae bacterium]